ncbi:MAG: DUF1232 domain-containing protein [Chloroflexi bacterium]|nr:DUF1232 domain-containing protein [Chloroflexota bacterium]MCI0578519.1 DUF1232 domain-containing protein [Chloroflexota bacterium]MCI0647191.1 DUF1232 domain-containing protein [Chloroflexota bacterium]MCI0727218.1 DUF1232 domain-containing protein [Chloroflexota bacterium]
MAFFRSLIASWKRAVRGWRERARWLKRETLALYLAYRDPRVPWYARLFIMAVVAYALSPIDLIPDPIPVLGYLDDLVLIPLGIALALRMIPPAVMAEARARAEALAGRDKPTSRAAAAVIVLIWLVVVVSVMMMIR